MDIRKGENKRESWWVTNNTNTTITIGDLLLLPALKAGKRVDLLHHYTREKISHSTVLSQLVKSGRASLNKEKIFNNEFPGIINPLTVDEAITPGEENEILKESEANDIYLRLDGSNAKGRIENRTSVTTTPYIVEKSDHHLSITTSSIAITLNLPSIVDGTVYHISTHCVSFPALTDT